MKNTSAKILQRNQFVCICDPAGSRTCENTARNPFHKNPQKNCVTPEVLRDVSDLLKKQPLGRSSIDSSHHTLLSLVI